MVPSWGLGFRVYGFVIFLGMGLKYVTQEGSI